MMENITRQDFVQKVEQAKTPVLVELWAPWCVYCRRLAPVLDRLEGKLPILKINIDEEPELAEQLDASTIPTLYVYQNGNHGEKLVAPSSQAQLEQWIDQQIGG